MRFAVITPDPARWVHVRAFDEVAEAIQQGLMELGHSAVRAHDPAAGWVNILFGGHHLDPRAELPAETILFNLEQIVRGSPWLSEAYVGLLRRHLVWDYSERNVEVLRSMGVSSAVHVPVGYAKSLERVPSAREEIDVLFYGRLSARRRALLQRFERRGWKVLASNLLYGAERDREVARARIVLNVHAMDEARLEVARCFYLLLNGRFVLSEACEDAAVSGLAAGMAFAPYDGLEESCAWYLAHAEARANVARAGQSVMRARPQAEFLRPALQALR